MLDNIFVIKSLKKVKKIQDQSTQGSASWFCIRTPHVLNTNAKYCTEEIIYYVKQGETAEDANILAKRMKEAKEKCQEKFAKIHRMSSLSPSSLSSQKYFLNCNK